MPVTPNLLLQAAAKAKAQPASANPLASPAEPADKASSFAKVYARQEQARPAQGFDGPARSLRDKSPDFSAKKDLGNDKSAAAKPSVADSGKSLPADKPAPADKVATDEACGTTVAADPATTPVVESQPATPATATEPALDPATAAALAAAAVAADPDFDPQADPLDALPAVRMAMEQSGHVSASSQAQASASPAHAQADGEPTSAQNFASGLANMLDVQADKDSTSQGGEKAFSGLIDDGLKDLKASSSDTRVEDFASRLAALTQAATPKTANAIPVNQPIAMHQSGWTEEVVNRVMYLSSANLKAADIQLQPAELGRLDIRVNMVPDQQTQVTFMSAHPGVREALDGQMHRLREMFVQQGMGQVDVNVSDQSRGQDQQQAQQSQAGRAGANGGRLDPMGEDLAPAVAQVVATSVIGSSAVDYYA
ncbi:flagellar hook-length control protein FliK [Pseudomonas violetae]|uniref:Flagellar hook-length control protein FliK n=1 Tax=Pseudomonas violetae TaxID=2915813 RepID=A0ABT0F808_9PSED|nr:flagellar hook-length control protein FliK [Pseudomonas violetae]MCK1793979.1 flagellar hook-length control protein FliK [Pseudomonas violetae]